MSVIKKQMAICGVCPGGCGIKTIMKDGNLIDVARLTDQPFSALCLRGKYAKEVVYSPHRLKKPLIRTGARGKGEFREAAWDEAFDYIVNAMTQIKAGYGAQAMVSHSGRGTFEQSMLEFDSDSETAASKFLLPFGSPNTASVSSLCYVSYGLFAPQTTFGVQGKTIMADFEHSKLIVIWGANPATDSPPFMHQRIIKARQRGAKIIAIDHMRTDIVKMADNSIVVRSGTDGALVLGILHVIINENLYDQDFVAKWTSGFEELRTYVQCFTPEKTEHITGVPQAAIAGLARELATTKPVSLKTYTGLEYSNSGVQTIRAVYILWALTGNLDVPGGLYLDLPGEMIADVGEASRPQGVLPIGAAEYPLFFELTGCAQFMEFPKAVLEHKPYAVKGLINCGASILTSYPEPHIWQEAFRNLDFMLVIDRFMTSDALYADVVLPAATYFEINSYQRYPGFARLRNRQIEPVGEARHDLFIFAELAKRLGYGHLYPQNEAELLTRAFARNPALLEELRQHPEGVRIPTPARQYRKYELGLLRTDGNPGFNTPSGKVEIFSALLRKHGYNGLPIYQEVIEGPLSSPEIYNQFPLVMNTGTRIHTTFRSQHLNIPGLLKLQPKPEVLISPADAKKRGIQTGDKVYIKTGRGQAKYFACVTDKVQPGSVDVNMGGGNPTQAQEWQSANANVLTDFANRDSISGFPVFKALLCQIVRCEAQGE
ncbi:MAG: molybdopterin-containing oxidoreductase family protein [Sporomusa sp.]